MAYIRLHSRGFDTKFKLAMYSMAEFALSRLISSKRLRDAGLLYKGVNHDPENLMEYFELPYEIEAYGREKGLLYGFLKVWKNIESELGLE